MKKVFLTRGLPGSGKSTWARKQSGYPALMSADDYFMSSGEYKFDPSLLGEAHKDCFRRFLQTLTEGSSQELASNAGAGTTAIVHNTFIQAWELSPYVLAGETFGYEVTIVNLHCTVEQSIARNVHNVPENTIRRMANDIARAFIPPFWKQIGV